MELQSNQTSNQIKVTENKTNQISSQIMYSELLSNQIRVKSCRFLVKSSNQIIKSTGLPTPTPHYITLHHTTPHHTTPLHQSRGGAGVNDGGSVQSKMESASNSMKLDESTWRLLSRVTSCKQDGFSGCSSAG